jgi:hypothetical protein
MLTLIIRLLGTNSKQADSNGLRQNCAPFEQQERLSQDWLRTAWEGFVNP